MPTPIAFARTRLAPSPTGRLHLGHARTFLVTWWMARQAGAQLLMRMEDLDLSRRKDEAVQQAYDDLAFLGIAADPAPPVVQSERLALYEAALERLVAADAVYPCTCTRADIAAAVAASVGAPQEGDATLRYTGLCRGRGLGLDTSQGLLRAVDTATGRPVCWRLRVPDAAVPFDDLLAGAQAMNVWHDIGDFPVTRFDGTPAYQLACVVDDHAMAMDAVIRGNDLLSSTPRQILLYRALGYAPPRFAHVPLVIGPDGKRLAKRHGESRIAQFRQMGVAAERLVGWAAWRSGQIDRPREMSAAEVLPRFDAARIPPQPVVLGAEDFAWLCP